MKCSTIYTLCLKYTGILCKEKQICKNFSFKSKIRFLPYHYGFKEASESTQWNSFLTTIYKHRKYDSAKSIASSCTFRHLIKHLIKILIRQNDPNTRWNITVFSSFSSFPLFNAEWVELHRCDELLYSSPAKTLIPANLASGKEGARSFSKIRLA